MILKKVTEILNNNKTCISMVENGFTYNQDTERIEFKYKMNSNTNKSVFYIIDTDKKGIAVLKAVNFGLLGREKQRYLDKSMDNVERIAKHIIKAFESKATHYKVQEIKETIKTFKVTYTNKGNKETEIITAPTSMDAIRIFTTEFCTCTSKACEMEFISIEEI